MKPFSKGFLLTTIGHKFFQDTDFFHTSWFIIIEVMDSQTFVALRGNFLIDACWALNVIEVISCWTIVKKEDVPRKEPQTQR